MQFSFSHHRLKPNIFWLPEQTHRFTCYLISGPGVTAETGSIEGGRNIHTIFLWILIKTGFFGDSLPDFHLLPELDGPRLGGHLVLAQLDQLVLLLEAQRLFLPQLRLRQHLLVLRQRI